MIIGHKLLNFSSQVDITKQVCLPSCSYKKKKMGHMLLLHTKISLRGRRLKGKGKGVLGARETRGAREEGGRETPARRPLFFSFLTSTRQMVRLQNMSITVLIP